MLSRKIILLFIACAVLGLFLSGVLLVRELGSANFDKKQVNHVLESYLQAWENADPLTMYPYLSTEDKKNISAAEYKEQFNEFPVQPMSTEIKSIVIQLPEAQVVVAVAWPDIASGKSIKRMESFYLQKEGEAWLVRESVSLEK